MAASRLTTFLETFDQDNNTRGKKWEHVCKWFLENNLLYRELLTDVWLWDEWPSRQGKEVGVDLVAQTKHGELWAMKAQTVCMMHGGKAPQALAKAEEMVGLAELRLRGLAPRASCALGFSWTLDCERVLAGGVSR